MAVSPIPPKVLYDLTAFIKLNISEEQLEKGYALFRQPGVMEWIHTADNDGLAAAIREGADTFHVQIVPSASEPMSCSCGESCCRHDLAAFLQLLRLAGKNPEMFLMECNAAVNERGRREGQMKSAAADPSPEAPETAKVIKLPRHKSIAPAFPQPHDSAMVWRDYFHGRFRKALVTPRPSAYLYGLEGEIASFYDNVMENMAKESAHWPAAPRGLFVLHAQLYAMEAIERFFARLPFTPHQYGVSQLAKELARSASGLVEQIFTLMDIHEAHERYPKVLAAALEVLRQNTFKPIAPRLDWSGLYRAVWIRLFSLGDLAAEERARLEDILNQAGSGGLESRIRSSLAQFDFFSGDDEAALAKLTADSSLSQAHYIYYVMELYHARAWSRLLVWLQGLTHFLQREYYLLNQTIFPLWLEGVKAQPHEPGWMEWIKRMLPQSRGVYITYLIENGEARQVAHMLLSEGYPLYYVDKEILKLLEKTDLRLILPLYHQDAERYILEKNRQSYKQAVRLLKKLAGFYKKLKEQDRWQAYIGQLAERHSRLRAFQEELRKGKLIV